MVSSGSSAWPASRVMDDLNAVRGGVRGVLSGTGDSPRCVVL